LSAIRLLGKSQADHSDDQVWATHITNSHLQKGFLYLVAVMHLHCGHLLSWKLSNRLETEVFPEGYGN